MNETLLQLGGRLHPMLLHLPIGVFGALVVVELWGLARRRPIERGARLLLVWLLAVTAGVSVGAGILLSREPGYVGETIEIHRWLGISTASTLLIAAALATVGQSRAYAAALFAAAMLIVPTGHLGASMTHGDGFLTEPFATPVDKGDVTEPPSLYASQIAPMLDAHCAMCHGTKRQKAGLALDTAIAIRAAKAEGVVPLPMMRRIGLPVTDDDHMPPEGKPQLSPAQIEILASWLEAGAPVDGSSPPDAVAGEREDRTPPVASAELPRALPHDAMASLQASHVHVEVIDPEAMLLWIDFAATPDIPLEDVVRFLTPLAAYTAELSLRGVEPASSILARCGPWAQLRRLDLSHTSVDQPALVGAAQSGHLVELTLIAAQLTEDATEELRKLETVEQLHVWGSNVPAERLATLRKQRPNLTVNDGAVEPPGPLEIEPEFKLGAAPAAQSLTPVNTMCPVSGEPIDAKYAIVHHGQVIAFCCEVCAGRFWEDPSAFPID